MKRRDEFRIGPREKAIAAIKAGNTEEALKYLDQTYRQFLGLHDIFANLMSSLQATIAKIKGDEWFNEFTRRDVLDSMKPEFSPWQDMTIEQRMQYLCNASLAHFSEFHVEEDDEKIVMVVTGCNAGGRLIRDGIAKNQDALIKKAYPWTWNRANVPYYCVHSYHFKELWNSLGIKGEVIWGSQYDDKGNPVDDPCRYILYK